MTCFTAKSPNPKPHPGGPGSIDSQWEDSGGRGKIVGELKKFKISNYKVLEI
jgi:hypothetical protein